MIRTFTAAALVAAVSPLWAAAQSSETRPKNNSAAQAKALAGRIDGIIARKLRMAKIIPGPKADSAQLARRLHLDLTGRIPDLAELFDFLEAADDLPAKVEERVDALLAGDGYRRHFARHWRSVLLTSPKANALDDEPARFEAWLGGRLASNASYDQIAREVLLSRAGRPGEPSPRAFDAVNELKAEKLASATSRAFLGHRLECAECHKDALGRWTQQQFWEFAAFFARSQAAAPPDGKKSPSPGLNKGEIRIPQTGAVAKARYLNGEEPVWKDGVSSRVLLADWVTSPKNPYFAKTAVSHVWEHFFGVSLAAPVFEPEDGGPPPHLELLEALARAFTESGFDLKFLIRAIVLTDAYQRAGVAARDDTKFDIQMFARMPVRGMTPAQLYDSMCLATGFEKQKEQQIELRARFLAMFASQDNRLVTQTSIVQALYLMNGPFIRERCRPEQNEVLRTIAAGDMTTARRVETLCLVVLSRPPLPEETKKLVIYIEEGGPGGRQQAVVDVYWALLNTSEFRLIP
jgi:hypothetical protein